jgi:hypothetical protein
MWSRRSYYAKDKEISDLKSEIERFKELIDDKDN